MIGFVGAVLWSKHAQSRGTCGRKAIVSMTRKHDSIVQKGYHIVPDNGTSLWHNWFTGGFPGGEMYFMKWVEGGMVEDIPELEANFQPSAGIKENSKHDQICYPYLGFCMDIDWDEALQASPA
mmetsp:Transcript_2869/g.8766  ORF Transcript_2869/g.8766 Transcript_2869/m.8766 type:complete len:123 (-) Transcript_2869:1959-2327(-)